MERMSLGSPSHQLNNSAIAQSAASPSTPSYLPSFLLGTDWNESLNQQPGSFRVNDESSPSQEKANSIPRFSPRTPSSVRSPTSVETPPGGPPIVSLSDFHSFSKRSQKTQDSLCLSPVENASSSFVSSPLSKNDNWVTVFGFPASQTATVVGAFSQYGKILDVKNPANGGNWVHLQYETKMDAMNALTRNGKLVTGKLMVGVVPCAEYRVLKDISNLNRTESNLNRTELNQLDETLRSPPLSSYNMRSLNSPMLRASQSTVDDTNVPIRSSGVLSKTMEYLFGL